LIEAGDLPLSGAEAKNEWISFSTPSVILYKVYSENCTFVFLFNPFWILDISVDIFSKCGAVE
jgi:hypothetical protein